MDYIANKVTKFCLRANLIDDGQEEWCCYSLLTALTNGGGFVVLIAIGLFLSPWPQVLLLNLGVAFLRSKAGGLHMPTPFTCFVVSLAFECLALLFLPVLSVPIAIGLLIASYAVLLLFAPCNNKAIHCSQEEIATIKHALNRRLLFSAAFILILFALSPHWANATVMAVVVVSLSVLLSKMGLGIR